ncbi:MAG: phosphate acyltransferase PlsX [Actinomycetota bacterium]|nr:phosphate acyltransferase PlsX [Actinomycetota bacterium]
MVAVDAMGGDRAPGEIVAGALEAARVLDVAILLVGQADAIAAHMPPGPLPERIEVLDASEVIAMHDEPAAAVRSKKDASLVRCAEAVRDGRADAMVGAGNTGATMAAALLRMGRIRGVHRPAIAVPIPTPGSDRSNLLVDGGATVDPEPAWLAQWAELGREYARTRLGVDEPTIGLLSVGEEPGKGDALRKAAYPLLTRVKGFRGNVEGRDLMNPVVDVVVTDGFTGNVALKTLEGAMFAVAGLVFAVLDEPAFADVADALRLRMLEVAAPLLPDNTGGALLLGVKGVCVISHGSSSATAIVNAVRVAMESVQSDVVGRLTGIVRTQGAAHEPEATSGDRGSHVEVRDAG